MPENPSEFYRYLVTGPGDRQWGLSVTGAGYQPSPPGTDFVPQRPHPAGHFYIWEKGRILNEYALVYVTHGEGEFESKAAGCRKLLPGDAMLLFPRVWHRYRPARATGWGVYWVHFQGDTADRLSEGRIISPDNPLPRVGLDRSLLDAFNRLLDCLRTEPPGYRQIAASITLELLARIVAAEPQQRLPHLQDAVRSFRSMLEEDRAALPIVEEMIGRMDVGRTLLFRTFKEQTGLTPYQYHLQVTIRRAGEMLRGSNLTVKQIARALRFENPYHFSRLFKKKTGMSPRQYRQHWREESLDAAAKPDDRHMADGGQCPALTPATFVA